MGVGSERGVALVTGGAGGIGRAVCRRLAAEGYRIALADLDAEGAARAAAELGAAHAALPVDLTDPEAAAALPARAAARMGRLDVIVNNAGMTDGSGRPLVDLAPDAVARLVALNLTAVARICAAAPGVLARGGRVVNLASGAAFRPLALRGPYSATKAGIVALTRALARDWAPRGLSVSAIAPGYTRTPLVAALQEAGRVDLEAVAATITLGRIGEPEEIAGAVAFAASEAGAVLSGQTLRVDGGSFGPPPRGAAPARGQAERGRVAVIGDLELPCALRLAGPGDLAAAGPLCAVIDARGLAGAADPARAIDRAHRTARACARAGRTAEFSLLFVSRLREDADTAAAVAAEGMLARTLALEWAGAGLRVNAVAWRRPGVEGLAALCAFLAGPDAALITGEGLHAG